MNRVLAINSINFLNKTILLKGWINKIRRLGNLTFIDLRDYSGIVQIITTKSHPDWKIESVIEVVGKVVLRKKPNPNLPTGKIEIQLSELTLLNKAQETPFVIKPKIDALEDTRLAYRYLELRSTYFQDILKFRHSLFLFIRNFFTEEGFIEVETPILTNPSPEGARDFLVASRINKHKFYALPQSPQLFKQLIVMGGIEKYFQIARCFRDEDLRSDRQLEFTQLDVELAFSNPQIIIQLITKLINNIYKKLLQKDITTEWQILKYHDAIHDYGTDKPDLRFNLKLTTITDLFANFELSIFRNLVPTKEVIRGIYLPNKCLSKKIIQTKYLEIAKQHNIDHLTYIMFENNIVSQSSIKKYITDEFWMKLKNKFQINESAGTILLVKGTYQKASTSLGAIRNQIGKDEKLYKIDTFALAWIIDWPLFEYDSITKTYSAANHPFTMPQDEWRNNFDKNKDSAIAKAYDIVINGYEVGGGSIRISDPSLQVKMLRTLGLNELEIQEKFGFFIDALKYGTPPHGGIALGLDRLVMILKNLPSIKETIAFPKNNKGQDLMMKSPSSVSIGQLEDLNIKLK